MDLIEKLQEYICYNQVDSTMFNVDSLIEDENNVEKNKKKIADINNICVLHTRKTEVEEKSSKKLYRKLKVYYAKLAISKR